MKTVFISHYFRVNPTAAISEVKKYAEKAWQENLLPVVPHFLFPEFADEQTERITILSACLELVSRCDELWLCGPIISEGMTAELAEAKRLGKTVKNIAIG